ncbi:hypothetical protein OBBRIDRAFT_533104 [Obba rivulosa]|uniref:C3H1-type domain-containing protein n=1 Tax=Obba rivulosa TaxID=1052685 RepID=A0A8E2DNT1_9APHY|nr:hypothetical protein OBBRIDRAFT_533104 [Obba rivulosa]
MKDKIRCYWYKDDGRPLKCKDGHSGCAKGYRCTFVHPSDREWSSAKTNNVRPLAKWLAAEELRPRSPPTRPRRVFRQKEAELREPSIASSSAENYSTTRSNKDQPAVGSSQASLPEITEAIGSAMSPTKMDWSNLAAKDPRRRPPLPPTIPSTDSLPPPPIAKPPPLPGLPLAGKWKPIDPSLSPTKEKEQAWSTMIRLMRKAAGLRADCLKTKEDISKYERILLSNESLEDGVKAKFEAEKAMLEAVYVALKKQLHQLVSELVDKTHWPLHAGEAPASDTVLDLSEQIQDLQSWRCKVENLVSALGARSEQMHAREEALLAIRNNDISAVEGVDGDTLMSTQQSVHDLAVHSAELDEVLEMMDMIEKRVDDVQREVSQHRYDLEDTICSMIEEGFDEMDLRTREAGRQGREQSEAALEERLQKTQDDLQRTGQEVDGIVGFVAQASAELDQKNEENAALKLENVSLWDEVTTLRMHLASVVARTCRRREDATNRTELEQADSRHGRSHGAPTTPARGRQHDCQREL